MEEGDFPDFLASRDLGDSIPFGQVFDSIKCLPATRQDSLEIPLSESFSLRVLRNKIFLDRKSDRKCTSITTFCSLIYMAVGLYDTYSFEWPFLLKFLCTKIVKQFVFLV